MVNSPCLRILHCQLVSYQAGRSKKRRAMASLDPGEEVSVKIVLAKPDAKYAVASSADGRVFVVQVSYAE